MRVCRVGAGGELCQMLFGNLEGWHGVCLYSIIDIVCEIVYQLDELCFC